MVLRITIGLNAVAYGFQAMLGTSGTPHSGWMTGTALIVIGVLLLIGFLTPVASVSAFFGSVAIGLSGFSSTDLTKHIGPVAAFNLAAIALSLVLLGPGAFSLDARLFGRREIIIPKSRTFPRR